MLITFTRYQIFQIQLRPWSFKTTLPMYIGHEGAKERWMGQEIARKNLLVKSKSTQNKKGRGNL